MCETELTTKEQRNKERKEKILRKIQTKKRIGPLYLKHDGEPPCAYTCPDINYFPATNLTTEEKENVLGILMLSNVIEKIVDIIIDGKEIISAEVIAKNCVKEPFQLTVPIQNTINALQVVIDSVIVGVLNCLDPEEYTKAASNYFYGVRGLNVGMVINLPSPIEPYLLKDLTTWLNKNIGWMFVMFDEYAVVSAPIKQLVESLVLNMSTEFLVMLPHSFGNNINIFQNMFSVCDPEIIEEANGRRMEEDRKLMDKIDSQPGRTLNEILVDRRGDDESFIRSVNEALGDAANKNETLRIIMTYANDIKRFLVKGLVLPSIYESTFISALIKVSLVDTEESEYGTAIEVLMKNRDRVDKMLRQYEVPYRSPISVFIRSSSDLDDFLILKLNELLHNHQVDFIYPYK